MSLTNELQGKEINYQKGFRDGMIEGSSKAVDMMTKNMQLSTEPLKIKLDKIDSKIFLKDYIKLSDVMGVVEKHYGFTVGDALLNELKDLKKQTESKGG